MAKKPASMKTKNMITDIFVHVFLVIVACVFMEAGFLAII